MGYAKYVGRVGALAVALGVGAAVASCPGIAFAAPSESRLRNERSDLYTTRRHYAARRCDSVAGYDCSRYDCVNQPAVLTNSPHRVKCAALDRLQPIHFHIIVRESNKQNGYDLGGIDGYE